MSSKKNVLILNGKYKGCEADIFKKNRGVSYEYYFIDDTDGSNIPLKGNCYIYVSKLNEILLFLKDIKSLYDRGNNVDFLKSDKDFCHIVEHSSNIFLAKYTKEFLEFVESTGRIYFKDNSSHENISMVSDLIKLIEEK